ncbi:MAG: bifunctional hydroxymethylpyrimidine kinase/phosphomethylpyrimidine kinase [Verrucomicrobiota bacterium]
MSSQPKKLPVALTIAGSDSGGGAGIQADLKTFAALGVHGTSAITCITAQNPKQVLAIEAVRPRMVEQQLVAIFESFKPRAVKTGMLYSAEIIQVVAEFFQGKRIPLIVDPVMIASSGARLLKTSAWRAYETKLLPLATLITPNLDEAEVLTGQKISSVNDLWSAAKKIYSRFNCAALVKGGHRRGEEAVDVFFDGKKEIILRAKFVKGVSMHGSGCTYSAAITGYLALGNDLHSAIQSAKRFITRAFQAQLE